MKYYKMNESANEHVEITEEDDSGVVVSAEFYFDYTIKRELMGRYGIFAVTEEIAEEFKARGFTGFEIGVATPLASTNLEDPTSVSLPNIVLLIVSGDFMRDDFSLTKMNELVISERVHQLFFERGRQTEKWSLELDDNGRPTFWNKFAQGGKK